MDNSTTSFGCAFLAQPSSLQSGGHASLGGGESFSFSTLATLAARGARWVVSTPPAQFLTEDGPSYPFLRASDFLATPVNFVAQELGAIGEGAAKVAAQRLSEVINRVVDMAIMVSPEVENLLMTGQGSLVSALQATVAPAVRHEELPQELLEAMPALFKAAPPISAPGVQDIAIRIPANRLRLARVVLKSAVPAGTWSEVDLAKFPTPASALSWATSGQQPVMCNVTVRGLLPRVKELAPMMRNMAVGSTRWMALPELVALSRMVNMVPRRIFVASDYAPAQASLKIPPPAFAPAAAGSISAGLFAEAYMHATCATAPLDSRGTSRLSKAQIYSTRAAWLTAVARSYMLQEAMALAEANINVIGFGTSYVLVGMSRRNLQILRKAISVSSLLSYPTGLRIMEEKQREQLDSDAHTGAQWSL